MDFEVYATVLLLILFALFFFAWLGWYARKHNRLRV